MGASEGSPPNIPIPILALPAGSILQFVLMTFPLLTVYLYFLFLAWQRPSQVESLEDRIRLMDILHSFLVAMVLFCSLSVYLIWFVKKRRLLSRRYARDAIVILGDVEFEEYDSDGFCGPLWAYLRHGCQRNDYGHVVYSLETLANHPAVRRTSQCWKGMMARKTVRVYHRYPREKVSILVLPQHPFSGQPKIDLEADWASFLEEVGIPDSSADQNANRGANNNPDASLPQVLSRDRSLGVLIIAFFWISFCFFSSLYVCNQISAVEQYYSDEDAHWAWTEFLVFVFGVVPLVAGGGNYLRWKQYEHWILRSGTRVKTIAKNAKDDDYVAMI